MQQATIDDYRWLIGDSAASWLQQAAAIGGPPTPQHIARFRRQLTASQTQLVWQQVQLRRRAAARFRDADKMFFTELGLQQATDDRIAGYKAGALAAAGVGDHWADVCCGIGGDLVALAAPFHVTGFDRDPIVSLLATANLHALGRSNQNVLTRAARDVDVGTFDAWHLDPDRRASGRRTTQVGGFEPSLSLMNEYLKCNPHGAIKLAPATQVPAAWQSRAQLEWIGHDRQCQQLLARFGQLAATAGQRTATTLDDQGRVLHTISGSNDTHVPPAAQLGKFLHEPQPAIIAAQLTGELALAYDLQPVEPRIAYLTGNHPLAVPAVASFTILRLESLDERRLRATLREAGVGQLEIKKRGVDIDPEQLRRQLRPAGTQAATLLIFPRGGRVTVAICRRESPTRTAG